MAIYEEAIYDQKAIYQEARVKLTNAKLIKLKSAAKNRTGTTLRTTKKNFQDEEFPHEIFLTTKQETKVRNVLAKNRHLCYLFTLSFNGSC